MKGLIFLLAFALVGCKQTPQETLDLIENAATVLNSQVVPHAKKIYDKSGGESADLFLVRMAQHLKEVQLIKVQYVIAHNANDGSWRSLARQLSQAGPQLLEILRPYGVEVDPSLKALVEVAPIFSGLSEAGVPTSKLRLREQRDYDKKLIEWRLALAQHAEGRGQ